MRITILIALLLSILACSTQTPPIKKETKSEALEALQFISAANTFPAHEIPDSAYGLAWDFIQQHFGDAQNKGAGTWQTLGPNNVGGRTLCIAIHPVDTNVIFLGSASGGLWKSSTGGYGLNAWQHVETGFPTHGVSCIAINPQNTQEMWIGTGETYDYGTSLNGLVIRTTRGSQGMGVLKTTDGGTTWTKTIDYTYASRRGIWDIVIDPAQTSTVWVATTDGILKTQDAGATWQTVFQEKMVMDLAIDYQNSEIVYAGVGNLSSANKGLYQTTDGGATWALRTNGLPTQSRTGRVSVTMHPSDPNVVLAHFCDAEKSVGLYKSTDKGQAWELVTTADIGSYQGWYSKCLHVRKGTSNETWVGGVYLWSAPTGTNFTQQTGYSPSEIDTEPWPDMHDLVSNPKNEDQLYLLSDAGLYRSNDNGINWLWCAHGYNVSQFYTGSVSATNPELVIGGLQDRNSQMHIGQNDWTPIGGGDGTFNAIDPTDDSHLYVSSQSLNISSTLNGFLFQGAGAAFVAPFVLAPTNPDVIYAGDIYLNKSINQGNDWAKSATVDGGNPIISLEVSRQNADKVYFGTAPRSSSAGFFVTTNGGQTITRIDNGLPNRYPRDLAIDPVDDQIVYVVYGGFGTSHVYKTTNGGQNWTALTGLMDAPFHTILVNPENRHQVWVGSDFGVFESNDSGATWSWLNQGIPEGVFVFELEYSVADKSLLAFTHGRGVYKYPVGNPSSLPPYLVVDRPVIYPNPCGQSFQIRTNVEQEAFVEVLDSQGNTRHEVSVSTNESVVLPASLLTGSYFVRIKQGDRVSTARLVKVF